MIEVVRRLTPSIAAPLTCPAMTGILARRGQGALSAWPLAPFLASPPALRWRGSPVRSRFDVGVTNNQAARRDALLGPRLPPQGVGEGTRSAAQWTSDSFERERGLCSAPERQDRQRGGCLP